MRHGNFHNNDCYICRRMDIIVWTIFIGLGILAEISLARGQTNLQQTDRVNLMLSIVIAFAVILPLWRKFFSKLVPQSHGWLFDHTGETHWYKPKGEKKS